MENGARRPPLLSWWPPIPSHRGKLPGVRALGPGSGCSALRNPRWIYLSSLGDVCSSDYRGPHPRERPGASAVLGTSSPCQGGGRNCQQGTRPSAPSLRTNIRSRRSADSLQLRALIPESAGRGPGLCASQVPQLILMGRHTRETTERRAGAGSEQTEPSWSSTFPEWTAPHIQNAGRGSCC